MSDVGIVTETMTSTFDPYSMLGGRYRLVERIAAGGQGEVWRAEDTALGRPAAVKVLRREYADNMEFRERFRREAKHAAGLSHPGVAQVFDYNEGRDSTSPYLVMEYVDGESLSTTIAREAPISPDRVLDIIIAVASALAAAHAAGLVHRDVKPGNLLLGRDGSVKITDFGIAQAVDAVPLTRTGMLIGTPLYLSPEQATGRQATAASDLYALGIIAYELLTGRPPYEGPPTAVLVAHRDTPLPPLPPSASTGLGDLVRALTTKAPAMRPQSATAVVEWATLLRTDPAMAAQGAPHPAETPLSAVTLPDQPILDAEAGSRRSEGMTQVLAEPVEPVQRRQTLPLALGGLTIAVIVVIIGIVGWLIQPAAPHRPADVQDPSAASSADPAVTPSTSKTPIRHRKPVATPNQTYPSKREKHGKHRH